MGGGNEDVVDSPADEEVPEKALEEADATTATSGPTTPRTSRKWTFIWLAVGVACIIGLSLGLRFGLDNNNDVNSTNKSEEETNSVPGEEGSVSDKATNTTSTNTTSTGGNNEEPNVPGTNVPLPLISERSLQESYDSCEALKADIKTAILMQLNYTINQYYNDPYLFNEAGYFVGYQGWDYPAVPEEGGSEGGEPTAESPAASDSSTAQKQVGESSYGTNVQVEGVDEPDMVKSDGIKVWVAYGPDVVVLNTNNTVLDRITIPSVEDTECEQLQTNILGMLLIDEKLLVIANDWCNMYPGPMGDTPVDSETGTSEKVAASDVMPVYQGTSKTRVLVFDKDTMTLLDQTTLMGDYITARAIESTVHIVNRYYWNYMPLMSFVDVYNTAVFGTNFTRDEYRAKALSLLEENLDEFVDQMLSKLQCENVQQIVRFQNKDGDTGSPPSIVDAMSFIYSIDMSSDDLESSMSSVSMLLPAGGAIVYASQEQLVLAISGYWFGAPMPMRLRRNLQTDTYVEETYLITYSLGNTATYQSYGTVKGYVSNPYFLHHLVQNGEDFLYVASVSNAIWGMRGYEYVQLTNATSQLSVLKMSDMSLVGQKDNLGKPGETIYAVRYVGERAFIVTYLQMDPFITMDLSDPYNPRVVGELEIPGFSNYLHQVDANHVLGVGQETNTSTGWTQGLKISLFDVSDLANPREVQKFVESGEYSSSDVQYDFLAFRYLPESKLMIIPVSIYPMSAGSTGDATTTSRASTEGFDGFRVYDIDETNGITVYTSISHAVGNFYDSSMYCWSSSFMPSRSMVFSGDMMTFRAHTITKTDLSTKTQESTVNLDEDLDPSKCSPYGPIMY
jgi:hypothetical protein